MRCLLSLLLVALLALPLFGYGITQLRTSTQLQDLLRENSRPLRNYRWLEENLGALVPVEVVLGFPRHNADDPRTMLERAEFVEGLRKRLSQLPRVGGTMAATTFAPQLPQGGGARVIMQRRVVARRLQAHRSDYEQRSMITCV